MFVQRKRYYDKLMLYFVRNCKISDSFSFCGWNRWGMFTFRWTL